MQFTPENEGPPQNSIADGEIRKSVTPVTKSIERNVLGGWVGALSVTRVPPKRGGSGVRGNKMNATWLMGREPGTAREAHKKTHSTEFSGS